MARSIKLHYACGKDALLGQHFLVVLLQEPFGIQRGHAAGSRRRDCLAIAVILDIASDKDARDGGFAAIQRDWIAVGVLFKLAAEHGSVGIVADGYENTIQLKFAAHIRLRVAQASAADMPVDMRKNFVHNRGRHKLNLLIGPRPIEHDLGSAKLRATVNEVNLAGVAGQEDSLLHSRVASADDSDGFASEEIAVAGGTSRDSTPHQKALGSKAEEAGRGAGGHNQCLGLVSVFSCGDLKRPAAQIDFTDCPGFELGAKPLRLLAHIFNEFGAKNALRKAGEVLDHSGQRELATRLMTIDH